MTERAKALNVERNRRQAELARLSHQLTAAVQAAGASHIASSAALGVTVQHLVERMATPPRSL